MTISFVGILTLTAAFVSFCIGGLYPVSVIILFYVLGSASALTIGSLAIIPINTLIPVAVFSVALRGFFTRRVLSLMTYPRAGFWLLMLITYAVFSGLLFPRLFPRITSVNPIGATDYEVSLVPTPLSPSSGNITQCIYIGSSIALFFVVYRLCDRSSRLHFVIATFVIYSWLNIAFAVLDVLTFYTGTMELLDFIRNANYTLHVNETMAGFKRIAGAQPEASTFAGLTLCNVAVSIELYRGNVMKTANLLIAVVQIILLLLSTSSTAYVGLMLLVAIYLFPTRSTLATPSGLRSWANSVITILTLVSLLGAICLFIPSANQAVGDLIETSLLGKLESESGIERSALNAQSLVNFFDTYGFGAGMGSSRSSSFALSVLANLGFPGAICYILFVASLFQPPSNFEGEDLKAIYKAARLGCAMILISLLTSGTNADFGPFFYIWAAVAFAAKDRLSAV